MKQICIPEGDGDKLDICPIYSGEDGLKNICLNFKDNRNGISHAETSLLVKLF